MENREFLSSAKNTFESLKNFSIQHDKLILNNDEKQKSTLYHVKLSELNQNIYLLDPNTILEIIRMIELLYKPTVQNEDELLMAKRYALNYEKLNLQAIENNEVDKNLLSCLGIPIYKAYDAECSNNPISKEIQNIINEFSNDIQNGRENAQRLVRTKPEFYTVEEKDPSEFAGFTSFFIIIGVVIITILYVTYFLLK